MSSTPPRNRRFPLRPVRAGTSTAQAGLAKIINIIVTVPLPPLTEVSLLGTGACPDAREISTIPAEEVVDLDLRLGLSLQASRTQVALAPATGVDDQNSTAHSCVFDSDGAYTVFDSYRASDDLAAADKSSEGECSPEIKPIERRSTKISDEDIVGGKAEASVKKGMECSGEGYIDLLLDAALLVSSEGWNHAGGEVYGKASAMKPSLRHPASNAVRRKRSSSSEMHRSKRARTSWAAAVGFKEYEKTEEPISRSKRGRALVLPSRYRDSILGPWRKTPTAQRR